MSELVERLAEVAQQIKKGTIPKRVTARKILEWDEVYRRGANVSQRIRVALDQAGLVTHPDFELAYIDEAISFVAAGSEADKNDPVTYRIGALESANAKPVSIKPDSGISEAFTVMLKNDYSQLPVMTTDREVKGGITWKSIVTKLLNGKQSEFVRDYIEPAEVIPVHTPLFEAIVLVAKHDYVLIQAVDRTICGIVTSSDLSRQLQYLAEPFVLVGECESLLRRLTYGKFSTEQLQSAKDPADTARKIEAVSDLTFGEYVRLLEKPINWEQMKLRVDRTTFIAYLSRVRDIRNDIMHFDPQGVDRDSIKDLQSFVNLLGKLRNLT